MMQTVLKTKKFIEIVYYTVNERFPAYLIKSIMQLISALLLIVFNLIDIILMIVMEIPVITVKLSNILLRLSQTSKVQFYSGIILIFILIAILIVTLTQL